MKTISGPKLQTFYTCVECTFYRPTVEAKIFRPKCLKLGIILEDSCCDAHVKTPINCPLLGKTTEEEDMNFDKDVLMRNL